MKNNQGQETATKTQEKAAIRLRGKNAEYLVLDAPSECIGCSGDYNQPLLRFMADLGLKILWIGYHDTGCRAIHGGHKNVRSMNAYVELDGEIPEKIIPLILERTWDEWGQDPTFEPARKAAEEEWDKKRITK